MYSNVIGFDSVSEFVLYSTVFTENSRSAHNSNVCIPLGNSTFFIIFSLFSQSLSEKNERFGIFFVFVAKLFGKTHEKTRVNEIFLIKRRQNNIQTIPMENCVCVFQNRIRDIPLEHIHEHGVPESI